MVILDSYIHIYQKYIRSRYDSRSTNLGIQELVCRLFFFLIILNLTLSPIFPACWTNTIPSIIWIPDFQVGPKSWDLSALTHERVSQSSIQTAKKPIFPVDCDPFWSSISPLLCTCAALESYARLGVPEAGPKFLISTSPSDCYPLPSF